jgi:hypothetical protein
MRSRAYDKNMGRNMDPASIAFDQDSIVDLV